MKSRYLNVVFILLSPYIVFAQAKKPSGPAAEAAADPNFFQSIYADLVNNPWVMYLILPVAVVWLVAFLLKNKKGIVFFAGREDQRNCFMAFAVPPLLYIVLVFLLTLIRLKPETANFIALIAISIVFLAGIYLLIYNAIVFNMNHKAYIPVVIFVKLFLGVLGGLSFIALIFSWRQNLRYSTHAVRNQVWLLRALSSLIFGIFMLIINSLTTFEEETEELEPVANE